MRQCYRVLGWNPFVFVSARVSLWLSVVLEYPRLPDMKQIGTGTQHVADMDAAKQRESTEIVIDSTQPETPHPLSESRMTRALLKHETVGLNLKE